MKKYLKIYPGHYTDEGRDTREMLAAREAGFDDICVVCRAQPPFGDETETTRRADKNGFDISDVTLKRRSSFATAARDIAYCRLARKSRADAISCHNLSALMSGYIAARLTPKEFRPKLIYDAHEFEPGRNEKRSAAHTRRIMKIESFLMKRCALNIVVNDSIADEYMRVYNLKERPLVVRSAPSNWRLDGELIAKRRKELTERLRAPDDAFILMYHGGLIPGRGIENIIECVSRCPDIFMVFMGRANTEEYMASLESLAKQKGVSGRTLFIPPVPPDRIWEYAGAANCGIHIIEGDVVNHRLCLPNKVFENIQSETPLITSDFPEMKGLIDRYEIGLTCDPEDLDAVRASINRMKDDKELYARFKENIKRAKAELCWENEKKPLIAALKKIEEEAK